MAARRSFRSAGYRTGGQGLSPDRPGLSERTRTPSLSARTGFAPAPCTPGETACKLGAFPAIAKARPRRLSYCRAFGRRSNGGLLRDITPARAQGRGAAARARRGDRRGRVRGRLGPPLEDRVRGQAEGHRLEVPVALGR